MKAIVQSLNEGGTKWGHSFWSEFLYGCAYRAMVKKERELTDGPTVFSEHFHLNVGTIFHALLALYYRVGTQTWETTAVKLTTTGGLIDEDARLEAERIFRAYRLKFTPKELGKVIAVEHLLEGRDITEDSKLPEYTARPDLVVSVTKRDADRVKITRWITIKPGYWLVDHKSAAAVTPELVEYYFNSLQMILYQRAWTARNAKKYPLQGALISITTKEKEPSFFTVVVPKNNAPRLAIANEFARQVQIKWADESTRWAKNASLCLPYGPRNGRICNLLLDGKCKRY